MLGQERFFGKEQHDEISCLFPLEDNTWDNKDFNNNNDNDNNYNNNNLFTLKSINGTKLVDWKMSDKQKLQINFTELRHPTVSSQHTWSKLCKLIREKGWGVGEVGETSVI